MIHTILGTDLVRLGQVLLGQVRLDQVRLGYVRLDWVDRINIRFCLTTSHPVILNSVISVSWYCYSRFRYIIFQFSCHFQIQISKLRLYQIPLYRFLLYQFPFSGYIRFCYIYFCYNIFQFHVITFSVISDSVISSSVISNSNLVISNSLYLIPLYQNLLYQIHCGLKATSLLCCSCNKHSLAVPHVSIMLCQNFMMVCPSRRPRCYVVETKSLALPHVPYTNPFVRCQNFKAVCLSR